MKTTTQKTRDLHRDFVMPTPLGQFEVEGQVVVGIYAIEWEFMVKIVEDHLDLLDHRAVMDDPKSTFIPLEEAEKNWFDNNIKKVRKRKKITQKELAKKMRVSQARVSRIENPDYRPSAGVYERAAKALGCGLTDLI